MDDDERRLLQERAYQLGELVKHPGWALLSEIAEETLFARRAALVNGSVPTMEKYRSEVGWISGCEYVFSIPVLIASKLQK